MRIFEKRTIVAFAVLALAVPALAIERASPSAQGAITVDHPAVAPATRTAGKIAPGGGAVDATSVLSELQEAAERGQPRAQWRLAHMYAEGDGVTQDDMRAFEYYNQLASAHADDSPTAPQSQLVANAFVAIGRYYLKGIPNSPIKADPERAREMFSYAASYFGNADAQYSLGRFYLMMQDGSREDAVSGARWLGLAAQKGQHEAQAVLGEVLFNGDRVPRQAARGLMYLTLARDSAGTDEAWIKESYNRAFAKASNEDRAQALQMLQYWVQGRGE